MKKKGSMPMNMVAAMVIAIVVILVMYGVYSAASGDFETFVFGNLGLNAG